MNLYDGEDFNGKFVLAYEIRSDICTFSLKYKNTETAGLVALVMCRCNNNVPVSKKRVGCRRTKLYRRTPAKTKLYGIRFRFLPIIVK